MEPGEECYEDVIGIFGKEIIKEDKTIDRKRVSDVVFEQPHLLKRLESVIHPAVKRYICRRIRELQESGCRLCVVEAALLLEEHYQDFCDQVWYIHTDPQIRIRRLEESRGYTREKAEGIIASQATEEYFRAHTDYVIENNNDLDRTYAQIREGIEKHAVL